MSVSAMILLPIMLFRYRIGGNGRYTPDWEFYMLKFVDDRKFEWN